MTNRSSPALCVSALRKRYKDVEAVAGVDLDVGSGECFGLLGPNGAGKTTTIEICEGLTQPDAGDVEVLGLRWATDAAALRQRLGIQLQETQLADKLTVYETLRLFRSFFHQGPDVATVVRLVQLEEKQQSRVGGLSGGQKQRLAVACALAGRPELLFLDEPTTGLDPQSRRQLWTVLEGFRAAGGTILLTTHYMDEAHVLCDRVGIMDRGRLIALGTPRELVASLGAEHVVEFGVEGPPPEEGRLRALPGVHDVTTRDGHIALQPEHRMRMDDQGLQPCGTRCRKGSADLIRPPSVEELDLQPQACGLTLDRPVLLGDEGGHPPEPGQRVLEQLKSLARQFAGQVTEAGHVPARPGQARDQADLLPGEVELQRRGQRCRTGGLDQVPCPLQHVQGRRAQLVLGDEHEVVERLPEDRLREGEGGGGGQPVGEGAVGSLDQPPLPPRFVGRRRRLGLHADHAAARRDGLRHDARPRGAAAAADRNEDRPEIGDILEHLQRQGGDAGDQQRLVACVDVTVLARQRLGV